MSILSVFMIGVGLSMDACAVSFAKGMCLKRHVLRYAFLLAFAFGLFQGWMPLLGWWIGMYFASYITMIDHWIAFFLLGFLGLHMLMEAKEHRLQNSDISYISWKDILLLAIATSIDALAIGISFAFLAVDIASAAAMIAVTTFLISFAAVLLGGRLGAHLGKYAEFLGGIILILIGSKILIEHLFLS